MTNAIVKTNGNRLEPLAIPSELTTMQTADVFAKSGFFADARDAAQAAVKILAGREIGLPPFASMAGVHIIKGKPAIGAGLMASRVKGSGRYDYKVREHTNEVCAIEFFQGAESLGVSQFTLEDAKAAGVLSNGTWRAYPKNMLFARCMSNGVRWYCPDVLGGAPVYTPEELGGDEGQQNEVREVRPRIAQKIAHVQQTADNQPTTMDQPEPEPQDPAVLEQMESIAMAQAEQTAMDIIAEYKIAFTVKAVKEAHAKAKAANLPEPYLSQVKAAHEAANERLKK